MAFRPQNIGIGAGFGNTQDYISQLLGGLPQASEFATQMQQATQVPSVADPYPSVFERAIMRQMEGPGPVERAQAAGQIGQRFNAAVGRLGTGSARRGFFAPGSIGQAAQRRPAAALANAFQQLEATRRRMLREGAANVGRQLGPIMQSTMRREDVGAQARGQLMGQVQQRQAQDLALRRTGAFGQPMFGARGRVSY